MGTPKHCKMHGSSECMNVDLTLSKSLMTSPACCSANFSLKIYWIYIREKLIVEPVYVMVLTCIGGKGRLYYAAKYERWFLVLCLI